MPLKFNQHKLLQQRIAQILVKYSRSINNTSDYRGGLIGLEPKYSAESKKKCQVKITSLTKCTFFLQQNYCGLL